MSFLRLLYLLGVNINMGKAEHSDILYLSQCLLQREYRFVFLVVSTHADEQSTVVQPDRHCSLLETR